MAHALKIKTVVSSKTLTLSDLDAFVGKHVEVTVAEDESMNEVVADHSTRPTKRRFGTMAGKIEIAEDFDQPLPPDIQRYFEGESD
jgi:hypothetical protein